MAPTAAQVYSTMKALSVLTFGAAIGLSTVAWADFFEDFDTDTSASWITLFSDSNPANHSATFSWDYFNDNGAALGFTIPSAPNSTGGTTKGLRLRTNLGANAVNVLSGLSASPVGQAFTGSFDLTADVWINYQGPAPAGGVGAGTTQLANLGWGTVGTAAQTNSNTSFANRDSVFLSTTLDGQSSVDWRVYTCDSRVSFANGGYYAASNATVNFVPGIYAAGDGTSNLQNSNVYYTTAFPSETLPASQALNYPTQTGATAAGSTGFKWRAWKLEKRGDILKWYIDGTLLATVDLTFCTVGASPNLVLGMMDSNSTPGVDPNGLNSMIVDNLRVVSIASNQHVTGTLSLGDTVSTFVYNRNISYEVVQGTLTLASGSVVANSPNTAFDISLPAAVTGAVTVKWNGSSFLKRNTAANLTGSNQAIGSVTMQNGDVNETGEVDAADIDQVIADFGQLADINSDVDVNGEVDAADIDIVIANFGGLDD